MRFCLAFVLLLSTLAFPAHAQMVALKCDGQMPCTFDQYRAGSTEWFKKADTNHDGKIDAAEQIAFWKKYLKTMLPDCTAQSITTLKLVKTPTDKQIAKAFAFADTNKDGQIDDAEDQALTNEVDQLCTALNNPNMQKAMQPMKQTPKNAVTPAPKPAK